MLDEELFASIGDAQQKLTRIEGAMAIAGLEADVRLVEVEVTTTYSRPHVVKMAEPAENGGPAQLEGTAEQRGEGVTIGGDGVWGSGVPVSELSPEELTAEGGSVVVTTDAEQADAAQRAQEATAAAKRDAEATPDPSAP